MTDLSGRWAGVFNYPEALPPTAFTAELREEAGALSGGIEEPDILRSGHPAIGALIEGRRDGKTVRFVKFYETNDTGFDVVNYVGTVADGATEITGEWDIPGAWSGTFLMVRETTAPAEVERAETATADEGAPVSPAEPPLA